MESLNFESMHPQDPDFHEIKTGRWNPDGVDLTEEERKTRLFSTQQHTREVSSVVEEHQTVDSREKKDLPKLDEVVPTDKKEKNELSLDNRVNGFKDVNILEAITDLRFMEGMVFEGGVLQQFDFDGETYQVITGELGAGGAGSVQKYQSVETGNKRLAVKRIRIETSGVPEIMLHSVFRELAGGHTLQKLQEESDTGFRFMRVYGMGSSGYDEMGVVVPHEDILPFDASHSVSVGNLKDIFIIYEFIDGHSLQTLLDYENANLWTRRGEMQGDDLDEYYNIDAKKEGMRFLEEMRVFCHQLKEIHQKTGFVHGDIKPSNFQLTPGGELVALDLGASHIEGQMNGLYCTSRYAEGERSLDVIHETDVRGSAFVLFEFLLKGKHGIRNLPDSFTEKYIKNNHAFFTFSDHEKDFQYACAGILKQAGLPDSFVGALMQWTKMEQIKARRPDIELMEDDFITWYEQAGGRQFRELDLAMDFIRSGELEGLLAAFNSKASLNKDEIKTYIGLGKQVESECRTKNKSGN